MGVVRDNDDVIDNDGVGVGVRGGVREEGDREGETLTTLSLRPPRGLDGGVQSEVK